MRVPAATITTLFALAARRRAPPVDNQLSDSQWHFTSAVRGEDAHACEVLLPAVKVPTTDPLWVGEVRELPIMDPSFRVEAQPLIASLRGNETFVFLAATSSDAVEDMVATEAKLYRAEWMEGTLLMRSCRVIGVGRYRTTTVAAAQPFLRVRGVRVFDEPVTRDVGKPGADEANASEEIEERVNASLSDAQERTKAAWTEAAAYARRVQEADGAPSSEASTLDQLLAGSVSLSDELETAGRILGMPRRLPRTPEQTAELAAAYRGLITRVLERQQLCEEGAAMWAATPTEEDLASQAHAYESLQPPEERHYEPSAAYDVARQAMLSHVALRLAAAGDEAERAFAEASRSGLERWERAALLLEAKRDELRVRAEAADAA